MIAEPTSTRTIRDQGADHVTEVTDKATLDFDSAQPISNYTIGDQGPAIVSMQRLINRRLAELGIDSPAGSHRSPSPQLIKVDGIFGPKTLAALKFLQCITCLETDGIAGPKTMAYLVEGSHGLPRLQLGSVAPQLRHIQRMYNIPAHGQFDLRTKRLVKAIQQRNDLWATGVLDASTWTALLFERVDAGVCNIHLNQK